MELRLSCTNPSILSCCDSNCYHIAIFFSFHSLAHREVLCLLQWSKDYLHHPYLNTNVRPDSDVCDRGSSATRELPGVFLSLSVIVECSTRGTSTSMFLVSSGKLEDCALDDLLKRYKIWHADLLEQSIQNIDGFVQDCGDSNALALELLQSCAKPWIWYTY